MLTPSEPTTESLGTEPFISLEGFSDIERTATLEVSPKKVVVAGRVSDGVVVDCEVEGVAVEGVCAPATAAPPVHNTVRVRERNNVVIKAVHSQRQQQLSHISTSLYRPSINGARRTVRCRRGNSWTASARRPRR